MSCGEVRERLAEHALGVLSPQEADEVDRHLDWCSGCRKEAGELQEALATVADAMPPADPPPSLEEHVVRRVIQASGRRPPARRPGVRLMVATTVVAVLAMFLAVGWGVAQRREALSNRKTAEDVAQQIEDLKDQIEEAGAFIQSLGGRHARLEPVAEAHGVGSVILVPLPSDPDIAVADLVLTSYDEAPYTLQLVDASGRVRLSGQLSRDNNGKLGLFYRTDRDLVEVVTASVLDVHGRTILTGQVELALPNPAA